jgi:hypothetical protein
MASGDGGAPTWPGGYEQSDPPRRWGPWVLTNRRQQSGSRPWLTPVLLLVSGAIIGCVLTLALLLFAGPRPAPLPVQSRVGHVTVTVDDAFLTAAIRTGSSSVASSYGISDLTAQSVPGDRVIVSGSSTGLLVAVPVTMTLQPLASNGVLSMHVIQATYGGVPLPGFFDAQIENAINSQIANLGKSPLSGTNYVVTNVTTSYGHITLTFGTGS